MAHRQHHLPYALAALKPQHLVCRNRRARNAGPRQQRGLRGARRTGGEHDDACLVGVPRLFAFTGKGFQLRLVRHRSFGQLGEIRQAITRGIDEQTLHRGLLKHIDARLARGVFQLHDAQLALFIGKARIQQRQRKAAVRRRQ